MNRIRNKIKHWFSLWDIEDLQIGCHCGLCGKWIKDTIVDKEWAVGICKECLEKWFIYSH